MLKEVNTDSQLFLLDLLAKSVFGSSEVIMPQAAEISDIFKESYSQTVIAIALDALNSETAKNLDTDAYNTWVQTAASVINGNMRNLMANCSLHKILKEAGIPYCTIKGNASAAYYPKPYLRQMGDIDFIVNECDFRHTVDLLEGKGFKLTENEHKFHIGFKKDGIYYELHKQISFLPKDMEYVFKLTDNLIQNSVEYQTQFGEIRVPDKFCHGMVLLLHMQRHIMNGEGIGLRHLLDWAVFAASFSDTEFCECFETPLRSVGLWRFAQLMSQTANVYLKMPYKKWMGNIDRELASDIIGDIFDGGNFGRKKRNERLQNVVMISDMGKNHSAPVTVILSLCKKIYIWKPFYESHKYLLPIGFLAYAARILRQIILKKKKIDLVEVVAKGTKRENLYKQFHFFDKKFKSK